VYACFFIRRPEEAERERESGRIFIGEEDGYAKFHRTFKMFLMYFPSPPPLSLPLRTIFLEFIDPVYKTRSIPSLGSEEQETESCRASIKEKNFYKKVE
jgi:hypothetical protein